MGVEIKVVKFNPDPHSDAKDTLDEIARLVANGTISELVIVGVNHRGEVTVSMSSIAFPFTVAGGLHAAAATVIAKCVRIFRQEIHDTRPDCD